MDTHTKVFGDNLITARTHLRRATWINLYTRSASFFRFAEQDIDEGIPRSVSDAFGKVVVSQKTFRVKIFNSNEIVAFHKVSGNFVGSITPLISNVLVKSLEFQNSFTSTIRTFLSASYFALKSSQLPFGLAQIFGRSKELAIRSSYQIANTHVKAHKCSCWLKKFWSVFHRKADVISISLSLDYCCFDDTVNRAMQLDFDVANMLDIQGFAFDSHAVIVGELHRVKSITSFESWVSECFTSFYSAKERSVRLIKPAKGALARAEVGLLVVFVGFPCCLVRNRLLTVGNRFFPFFPGVFAFSKGIVVEMPMRLKHSVNRLNLLLVWIQSVFIRFQHWIQPMLRLQLTRPFSMMRIVYQHLTYVNEKGGCADSPPA